MTPAFSHPPWFGCGLFLWSPGTPYYVFILRGLFLLYSKLKDSGSIMRIIFSFLLDLWGCWLIRLHRFQVYNCIIYHLYIVSSVYQGVFTTPSQVSFHSSFIPALPSSTSFHPLPSVVCVYEWVFFFSCLYLGFFCLVRFFFFNPFTFFTQPQRSSFFIHSTNRNS